MESSQEVQKGANSGGDELRRIEGSREPQSRGKKNQGDPVAAEPS